MAVSLTYRKKFLKTFQEGIIQGRKLLFTANHHWGDRLLTDLYFKIEKSDWIDIQKKHQLIMVLANSWWMYINSLSKEIRENDVDLIKYIDAYKRFYSFLIKIDDFYLLNSFFNNLLKKFIKKEELSLSGITNFINSFCFKVKEKEENQKLIELQLLLTYLRKSVFPQDFFHLSMELIGRAIFKIDPGKRALFLYVLLENTNLEYDLMENSDEFVKYISKTLVNRIPSYLKSDLSDVGKIQFNERNYQSYIDELNELIYYLNNIAEDSWIILIIKNIFTKLSKFSSFGEAITYIRRYIDFAVNRNRFDLAFAIYDYLEDIFLSQSDLGYDNVLIELWLEACKKFVVMNEKRYLLQSLEKLNNYLKIPQTNAQILHYFHTGDILWQLKSRFFSLDQKDFWRMMFHRALFEEKDIDLAKKLFPYLDKNIQAVLPDLEILLNDVKSLVNSVKFFDDEDSIPRFLGEPLDINQMIFRIDSNGLISYRFIFVGAKIVEGRILNEFWNDAQLFEIFNSIYSETEESSFDFSITDLGKLMFLFLNKSIRNLFKQFKVKSLGHVPEIYFILDQMTIPFELIFDNNFFLLKYSMGYIIGEPPLEGVSFEEEHRLDSAINEKKYKVLIIESTNSANPLIWNEQTKKKESLFDFPNGGEELDYILNFFNNREEIIEITILAGLDSTRDKVISYLKSGDYSIIHFIGNVFYSELNPFHSYFLTNDDELITFYDINTTLKSINKLHHPFIFFNTQLFDTKGKKLTSAMRAFGEIIKDFDLNLTCGILAKVIPIFDDETQTITSNFYIHFLNDLSQGISLLKARQECMVNRIERLIEQDLKILDEDEGSKHITIQNSKSISSFILYGKPWKKIN